MSSKFPDRIYTASLIVVVTAAAVLSGWTGAALSDSKWENHMDASLIRDAVYHDGAIYMATNGGLLKYTVDTGEFDQIDNTRGLPSNSLTCLLFGDNGELWIGTSDVGLSRVTLRPGNLGVRSFSPLDFPGLWITSLDLLNGELVFGTTEGAGRFVKGLPGPLFPVKNEDTSGLPSMVVNDVFTDGSDLWFATDGGVAVRDRLEFFTEFPDGPPVAYAVEKADGYLWVGTNDGVWRMALDDSTWTQLGPDGIPASPQFSFRSLHWDGQKMWAGGPYSFYDWDETGSQWRQHSLWRLVNSTYLIPGLSAEILGLVSVPGGDLFVGGSSADGLRGYNVVRYDGQDWENLLPNTPGENRVKRVARDIDGSIWVTIEGFGVGKVMPDGNWVNYNRSIPESDSLSNLFNNLTLLVDLDGHKWISTLTVDDRYRKPLDELDDKLDADYSNDEWTRHELGSGGGDGYGTLRPQRATLDPAGNRWFLADERNEAYPVPLEWRGIHILSRDKTEWLQVRPEFVPEMGGGNITDVAFSDDGIVYVAIKNYGVQSWETGGYDWASLSNLADDTWGTWLDANVANENELGPATTVTSVALRSDDVLWIGTNAGVYKYTPYGNYRRVRNKESDVVGLLSQTIKYVLLDHHENVWVASDLGINKISRDDDNDIEAYTTTAVYQMLSLIYSQSVISPLAGASCFDLLLHPEEDLLYIATNGGLSIFDITPLPPETTDLTTVYFYPNPVNMSKGHDQLRIDKVDGPVSIEVYDLEGNLVHKPTELITESEQKVWDMTGLGGFFVASGVYFIRVDNGVDSVIKPVTVIR